MNIFFIITAFVFSFLTGKIPEISLTKGFDQKYNACTDSIPQTNKNAVNQKKGKQTEDLIIQKILSIPEVKAKSRYIDSLSGHKSGITIIIVAPPSAKTNYYWVQAGYNNEFRFEPYYNFYVYPPTLIVKFYDTINDKILSLEDWRKSSK